MDNKKKLSNKFKLLILILILLIITIISSYQLITLTNTRYIKKEKDEIRGYYTSLNFQGTGEGNCIVLENNVGHTSFQLMNFIGEDVTKRDIEYNIKTIDTYFDSKGQELKDNLSNLENNSDSNLYVKDVWGRPQAIKYDTYKYDIKVVSNNSETGHNADHMFSYQEVDNKGVGKTHNITIEIKRKNQYNSYDIPEINGVENISIVVELVKPYKDVYIINMVVVDRLIAFTSSKYEQFDVEYQRLNIQTADSFSKKIINENTTYTISPKAFLVTLNLNNLYVEKRDLSILHNVIDLETIEEAINNKNYSNIDINKPYIVDLQLRETGDICISMYIPQSSSINIDFLPLNDNYSIKAQVYYFDPNKENKYTLYEETVGGHEYKEYTITVDENDYQIKAIYVLGNEEQLIN